MKRSTQAGFTGGGTAVAVFAVLAAASSATVLARGSVGEAAPIQLGSRIPGEDGVPTPSATNGPSPASSTTLTSPPVTVPLPPPVPMTPAAIPAAVPPVDPAALPALGWGDRGEHVQLLQDRLTAMGFRPSDDDGRYRAGTASAVLAFQKFEGLDRTGEVDAVTWQHLFSPVGYLPPQQPALAPKVEVDLERQVLFVLNAEHPGQVTILNTSTGGEYYYTNKDGSRDYAFTPEGSFQVYRRYNGVEEAPLGTLYRPLYFHRGWAVHGSPSVPSYPASHGCVRLSNNDQDWLWDRAPDSMEVVVRATMNPETLRRQQLQEFMDSYGSAPPIPV